MFKIVCELKMADQMNIDTTNVAVDQSSDAFAQMQTYSGQRGKGHCYLFSNVTDNVGAIVAVTPGPNISCTPRGGDGVSLGVQLGLANQSEQNSSVVGFAALLRGSQSIGGIFFLSKGEVGESLSPLLLNLYRVLKIATDTSNS